MLGPWSWRWWLIGKLTLYMHIESFQANLFSISNCKAQPNIVAVCWSEHSFQNKNILIFYFFFNNFVLKCSNNWNIHHFAESEKRARSVKSFPFFFSLSQRMKWNGSTSYLPFSLDNGVNQSVGFFFFFQQFYDNLLW